MHPLCPYVGLHSRNVYSELLEYKPRLRVLELFLRRPSDDTQTAVHDFTGDPRHHETCGRRGRPVFCWLGIHTRDLPIYYTFTY